MNTTLTTKSKCDMVVDRLLAMIVNGEYVTGSQLPTENELCELYGVSRITVRESLKKLQMTGVVDIQQGKGTFVKQIGLGNFMQPMFNLIDFGDFDIATIYDARRFIETGTCRLAAQYRTDEERDILRSQCEELEQAFRFNQPERIYEIDRAFHIEIGTASKNQILRAAVINLENISAACAKRIDKHHAVMQGAADQHWSIFSAIEARNADAAEAAIIEHTLKSKEFLD